MRMQSYTVMSAELGIKVGSQRIRSIPIPVCGQILTFVQRHDTSDHRLRIQNLNVSLIIESQIIGSPNSVSRGPIE